MAIRIHPAREPSLSPEAALAADAPAPSTAEMSHMDQIKELIPGTSTAFYVAALGLFPNGPLYVHALLALLGLALTVIVKAQQKDQQGNTVDTDWIQVIIASVAFVIWVYALGSGAFATLGWYQPAVSALLLLVYTYFAPQILRLLVGRK
jgi:hypothetical protein